jgi:hypothetical protein
LAHDFNDLGQDLVHLEWQWNLLTVWTKKQTGLRVALDEARKVEKLIKVLRREDDLIGISALCGRVASRGVLGSHRHAPILTWIRKKRKPPFIQWLFVPTVVTRN